MHVIVASNADFVAAVKKGSSRDDLFYRLNVLPIVIPPLREPRSDIPLLIDHFPVRLRERRPGHAWHATDKAMVHLWSYDWPGNVRELENMVERRVILSEDSVIDPSILAANLLTSNRLNPPPETPALKDKGVNLNAIVREFEGAA